MYRCNDCTATFDEPDEQVWNAADYYGVEKMVMIKCCTLTFARIVEAKTLTKLMMKKQRMMINGQLEK